ncbi:MAG: [protein-PII] uridylyltransferase [Pseudomonadota bacterium]
MTARASGAASLEKSAFAAELSEALTEERAGKRPGALAALMRRVAAAARVDAMQYADRGDRIAARLSRSIDSVTKALFAEATAGETGFALCAIGGYGRRELAPFSDIDLLLLHEAGREDAVRRIVDFMLYPLWDSGLKIGHAVHTPKSALDFAKEDMIARTAYLDARYIAGSNDLYTDFLDSYEKLRKRTGAEFVAAKLREQGERQKKSDETRYLVEPNIKEGKGGLRDVQTIRWIYKYVFGDAVDGGVKRKNVLGDRDLRDLVKAERFLWSVRAHLHDLRGRADEHLAFDVQPHVAERLGYADDRRGVSAAERLMRHYFVTAVDTGRLTRVLCARLEEISAKRPPRLPKGLPKTMQKDEAPGRPNLRIRGGRLDFRDHEKARDTPLDFFRLFRAHAKDVKLDLHPDAVATVSNNVASVTTPVRRDEVVAKLFKGVLESNDDPVRVLRVMTEAGLLGKFLPTFGGLVGRIHYSLYRRYTLDEQALRAFGVLRSIASGRDAEEHPVSTSVLKRAQMRFPLMIAVLLHEAEWTLRDRSSADAEKLLRRVMRRLGVDDGLAAIAAWAGAHYQLIIRTAERRNLTVSRTIAQFAKAVGSAERLDAMVVVATCHLRVVGHDSWDQVTRRQLIELYEAATTWREGGEPALVKRLAERAALAREEARTRLADWSKSDRDAFLERLTDDMLRCVDSDIIVRFAYLARAAEEDAADAAVTVTPRDGDLECIVYADDRPGLLADVAGAAAGAGLSVRSVQALTTNDGRVFDIFALQSAGEARVDDPAQSLRVHQALLAAARARPKTPPDLKRRLGDRRAIFTVEPRVKIERNASDSAVVVETEGLDRPGLLFETASALTALGVSIVSAHVATYGERAVDAFYLTDAKGRKINDARQLKRIEKRLLQVLATGAAR